MSAQALIRQAQASGVALRLVGGKVKASGPREAVARLLAPLREHRMALADALQAERVDRCRAHPKVQQLRAPTGMCWTRPIWPTTSTVPLALPRGVAVGMASAAVLAWRFGVRIRHFDANCVFEKKGNFSHGLSGAGGLD